ncbi:unnamed protein product [Medioppia subpectinata]|uniref:Uncharacterized protein n=1 Tax=Medioppia subpectinata TaxID=1979941 RepID=A0A7R9L614_9ACAR|nr:unnamed protein product [Medioppia subpectinata]CAG2114972.1 unnamed protein product [Medioppia subpectinata]
MFKIFNSKPKKRQPSGPTAADAIQRLTYLEKKIETEVEIIRKNGTRNKKVSLQALKRKKRLESQLQQIDGTLTTLESQRISLENANTNVQVLQSMKYGADALKVAQNTIGDVDRVQDVMDDIREQQELAQEISDLISNPVGFGQDVGDDDELLQELEELEQQELDQQLLSTDRLPSVPTAQPLPSHSRTKTKAKFKESEEMDNTLKELADWGI